MCGRYTVVDPSRCFGEFSLIDRQPALESRYNVAPSHAVAVVRVVPPETEPRVDLLRWGFLPRWAPKSGDAKVATAGFVMARSETVARKGAFAASFREKRCLFLADGFYEWKHVGRRKFPFYIRRPSGDPFTIAGIWDHAVEAGDIDTCALITRPALAPVDTLHDRMPVIIEAPDRARWLDPACRDPEELAALLTRAASDLVAFPVSPRVNAPANDDPSCIAPVADVSREGEQTELWPSLGPSPASRR
jgi:putative SOS response-associated peptidase YedK